MSEPDRTPQSPGRRIAVYVLWIVIAVVVLFALVRVFIRPVAPAQEAPPGHYGEPCVLCHIVTEGAEIIEFSD